MTQSNNETFRAAIVQMRSSRRVAANLVDADRLIREAAATGAQYIQTPENTALMELDPQLVRLEAQPFEDNAVLAMFRSLARELKVWLHIGSLAVRLDGKDRLVNRSCLLSPDGQITAWYDKIHLFDVDLSDSEAYRESKNYQPGRKAVLADMPFARLGFSVCYDLRFPGLYRVLAKTGADLLAVPAAFTEETGKAHWHVLLRARAIENGCYVVAAAQGGEHENGRRTFGHSLIISPWGEILAEADTEPQVIVADIDLAEVKAARARIPALRHDRPFEIFSPEEPTALEDVS